MQHTFQCARGKIFVKFLGFMLVLAGIFYLRTAEAKTVITATTTATDTVWVLEGSPYIVGHNFQIESGATLTIEPGVIVKMQNGFFVVYGKIIAFGSADQKIYFTSLKDDSIGGDTNEDGSSTLPSRNDNWGLVINGENGASRFENVVFQYGAYPIIGSGSEIVLSDVDMKNGVEAINMRSGKVKIFNTHVVDFTSDFVRALSGAEIHATSSIFENPGATSTTNAIQIFNESTLTFSSTTVRNTRGSYLIVVGYNSRASIIDSLIENHSYYSGILMYESSSLRLERDNLKNIGYGSFIQDQNSSYLATSTINIVDTTLSLGTGDGIFLLGKIELTVASSTFEDLSGTGVIIKNKANLKMEDSVIRKNGRGIDLISGAAQISGSSIYGNTEGIRSAFASVDARNNWWGDTAGPFHETANPNGLGDAVSDNVAFIPWLTEDPFAVATCCSSVAFIPGFQGSRLYKEGLIFENQLWTPNRNDDVRKLYLDENGAPLDSSIYTRDIIDEVFGFNVYKKFMEFMDGLVATSTISAWKPFPYDWRLGLDSIVNNSITLEDGGSYSMIDEIEKLAVASKTGKVTLITHSNGGLVAKKLIQKLESLGKADLVDKLIMVAAPQLGTPKAVASMLHGFDQDIAFGFFLSQPVARGLGENMESAYNLLPSARYFSEVLDPPVVFDPSSVSSSNLYSVYGNATDNIDELYSFLTAQSDGRAKPDFNNIFFPTVLRNNLLDRAKVTHNEQDNWVAPEDIEVIQIAGWGIDTVKSVKYVSEDVYSCNELLCGDQPELRYKLEMTQDGDKVVVVPSAISSVGENYYVNIKKHNQELGGFRRNRQHSSILEINELQDFVENLITNSNNIFPLNISDFKPVPDETDKILRIGIHSPVSVNIYDDAGNHTGLINNPDPNSDLQHYEENVPNSYYFQIGESKFAGVSLDSSSTTIKLLGTGIGTFTLETEVMSGANTMSTAVFKDIPVTSSSTGLVQVGTTTSDVKLIVDIDGNGTTDFTSASNTVFDPIAYLKSMKVVTLSFHLKSTTESQLLSKIDVIIDWINKKKVTKAIEETKNFIQFIKDGKGEARYIPEIDRQVLIRMLNNLLDNLN